MPWGWGWRPYVPVAQRRANAARQVAKLLRKGTAVEPVTLQGRQIARTFWGKAWCDHLESFGDFANRLPRGRSYVRNGSVCHLSIAKGKIEALVSGSALYQVTIAIKTLQRDAWTGLKRRCAGQIASLLDLLQGRLSDGVMGIVTDRAHGLFPQPGEISMQCSCPDWAVMCKHVAAVLYGAGSRFDAMPELLFTLRGVDHTELVQVETAALTGGKGRGRRLRSGDLEAVFGIELAVADAGASPAPPKRSPRGGRKSAKQPPVEPVGAPPRDRPEKGSRARGKTLHTASRRQPLARRTSRGPRGSTA